MVKREEPIKIEIEDLNEEPVKAQTDGVDIAEELRTLGRQFAETVQTAWQSPERQRLESEFKEGVHNFVEEMGKVLEEVKTSPAAQRVRDEASKVDATETSAKLKGAIAQGLGWLSDEFAKLSTAMNREETEQEIVQKEPPTD